MPLAEKLLVSSDLDVSGIVRKEMTRPIQQKRNHGSIFQIDRDI